MRSIGHFIVFVGCRAAWTSSSGEALSSRVRSLSSFTLRSQQLISAKDQASNMAFSASFGIALIAVFCLSTISARPQNNPIGVNSNLGLGPVGNVGGGLNFEGPGSSRNDPMLGHDEDGTTKSSSSAGVNSNIGLGPLGNVGGGFSFPVPASTTPAMGHDEDGTTKSSNVGVNSNIGLGPAGNVGGGFSFPIPSSTAKTSSSSSTTPAIGHDEDGTTTKNNIGINSNLGLGPLGNVGGGFNFVPPSTTPKTRSMVAETRSTTRRIRTTTGRTRMMTPEIRSTTPEIRSTTRRFEEEH